jgi:hypothetical protein
MSTTAATEAALSAVAMLVMSTMAMISSMEMMMMLVPTHAMTQAMILAWAPKALVLSGQTSGPRAGRWR